MSTHRTHAPQPFHIPLERRRFLKAIALASAGFTLPGYLAETAYTASGQVWPVQNSNDGVLQGVADAAQRSAITLDYSAVDATVGSVGAGFDFAVGVTPTEPPEAGDGDSHAAARIVGGSARPVPPPASQPLSM